LDYRKNQQVIIQEPSTEEELLERCTKIAGLSVQEIADKLNIQVPKDLSKTKGWLGQLIEKALGANAGNLAEPDFIKLGIELKTIPVDDKFRPTESTYVCTAPTSGQTNEWRKSVPYKKLNKVLWIPIEAAPNIPLSSRRIVSPSLVRLDNVTEQILRQDWLELTENLYLGKFENISAKSGTYLHLRPKASNSGSFTKVYDENNEVAHIVPKGFYLRTSYTKKILKDNYLNTHNLVN